MCGGYFLGTRVTTEHHLITATYVSIVTCHVYPFMTTLYPSSNGSFQVSNVLCYKAQILSNLFLEYASTVNITQSNPALLVFGGTGDSHHESAAAVWRYHNNTGQNWWIYAMKNEKKMNEYFLKVKTAQPYQGVPNKMSISCILKEQ